MQSINKWEKIKSKFYAENIWIKKWWQVLIHVSVRPVEKTFSTTIGGRRGLAGPSANAGSAKIGGPADPWDPAAKTGSVTICAPYWPWCKSWLRRF